jgi:hypothetical protein
MNYLSRRKVFRADSRGITAGAQAGTQFQNTAIGIEGKNLIGHYGFWGDKVNYAEDFR